MWHKVFILLLALCPVLSGQGSEYLTENINDFTKVKIRDGLPEIIKESLPSLNPQKFEYADFNSSIPTFFLSEKMGNGENKYWIFTWLNSKEYSFTPLKLEPISDKLLYTTERIRLARESPDAFEIYYSLDSNLIFYRQVPGSVNAKFTGGLRVEPFLMIDENYSVSGKTSKYLPFSPISFYVLLGFKLPEISVLVKGGILYANESFYGLEYGLYLYYYLSKSNFYFLGGVNFHQNGGEAHGVLVYEEGNDNTFTLVGIGAGFSLSKSFSFELLGYLPFEKNYGHTSYGLEGKRYEKNVYGIIKFGFGVVF